MSTALDGTVRTPLELPITTSTDAAPPLARARPASLRVIRTGYVADPLELPEVLELPELEATWLIRLTVPASACSATR